MEEIDYIQKYLQIDPFLNSEELDEKENFITMHELEISKKCPKFIRNRQDIDMTMHMYLLRLKSKTVLDSDTSFKDGEFKHLYRLESKLQDPKIRYKMRLVYHAMIQLVQKCMTSLKLNKNFNKEYFKEEEFE